MAEPNEFGGASGELHSDGADSDEFERFDSGADEGAAQPPRSAGPSRGGPSGGASQQSGDNPDIDEDADADPFDDDF